MCTTPATKVPTSTVEVPTQDWRARLIPLSLKRKADAKSNVSTEWEITAGSEVAQWLTKLDVMEEKIKKRETCLKKFRAHLEAAKKYSVDFTNPVEWHEEMLTELPWKARHVHALTDRQIARNLEPEKLTQRLMTSRNERSPRRNRCRPWR